MITLSSKNQCSPKASPKPHASHTVGRSLAGASSMLHSAFCFYLPGLLPPLPMQHTVSLLDSVLNTVILDSHPPPSLMPSPAQVRSLKQPYPHLTSWSRTPTGAPTRSSPRIWTEVTLMQKSQSFDGLLSKLLHLTMLEVD